MPEEEFPIPPRRLPPEPAPPRPPPDDDDLPDLPPLPDPDAEPPPVPSVLAALAAESDEGDLDRPPLHPPFDGPPSDGADDEEDPDAILNQRRERLARAGMQRAPSQPKKRRSLAWLGWLLLIALLGAVIGGGYEKRTELVAFYPPLARLYEKLGLPVDTAEWLGLELHNLKSATILEDGQTRIAVSGEVVNVGDAERPVPAIRVSMRGAGGKELAAYTLKLEQPAIEAGGKQTFDVKLPAPKDEVTDLEVAFASQAQMAQ
ncbi:DUF3426 domain-containing protein [Ferrovibrio sp.]|uniref:DUF3426 domain-containing protein n=2 Tax=Ferrovibrio sp. TaxID=1917215 RepID=UPI0035140D7A